MAKQAGGKGRVEFTLAGDPDPVLINLCVSAIDSINLPKGFQPSTTTCNFDETLEITFTDQEQTTAGLEASVTAFSEEVLTEAQEAELFDTKETGPVILRRHGTYGFYLPLVTVEVDYKPGGTDALQMYSLKIKNKGIFYRGIEPPA